MQAKIQTTQRRFWAAGIAAVLALTTQGAIAQECLSIRGFEITAQGEEHGAVFLFSVFDGWRWCGWGAVEVRHAPLPEEEGDCSAIELGGRFWFTCRREEFQGVIIPTGLEGDVCDCDCVSEICGGPDVCGGPEPDFFSVSLLLLTDEAQCLCFDGELDHTPLCRRPPRPPTVSGTLCACEEPAPE